jgi:hypothetical protein
MIFSVTETLTWKRCRRKWALQSENMLGLQPIKPAPALMLGSLMHGVLEDWTNQRIQLADPAQPVEGEETAFFPRAIETIDKYKQQYKDALGFSPSEVDLEPLMDAIALGQDMYSNYIAHYGKPVPKGWKLIALEQRTITDIPGTEHWECEEQHLLSRAEGDRRHNEDLPCPCGAEIHWQCHQIRGTLDGLLQRNKDGLFYALERKTYGQHPRVDNIAVEEQMRTYCWILRQIFGDQAGFILYDGMWKRDGSNKKHKPEDLFYRQVFTRTQHDLDECGEQLAAVTMDMAAHVGLATDDPRLYTNRRWEGCTDCGMNKLCTSISKGEDADDIRRTDYTRRIDENLSWLALEEGN